MPKKFIAKDGQVDFTDARYAPVVNTVIFNDGKILLLKRSQELNFYPGFWNGVSGFLDDLKSVKEKIFEELSQELGLKKSDVSEIKIGQPFLHEAPEYKKTWVVVPALVSITKQDFRLDFETERVEWFEPKDIKKMKLVPGFEKVVSAFPKV